MCASIGLLVIPLSSRSFLRMLWNVSNSAVMFVASWLESSTMFLANAAPVEHSNITAPTRASQVHSAAMNFTESLDYTSPRLLCSRAMWFQSVPLRFPGHTIMKAGKSIILHNPTLRPLQHPNPEPKTHSQIPRKSMLTSSPESGSKNHKRRRKRWWCFPKIAKSRS